MLLNLQNGVIESEFHDYVRPTYRPILSEYCTNLTGITQALIDAQANFLTVFQRFTVWLEKSRVSRNLIFAMPNARNTNSRVNTAFCSWTNWDLSTFLRLDCQRHGIQREPHLRAWIDARKIFEVSLPSSFLSIGIDKNGFYIQHTEKTLGTMLISRGIGFHKHQANWKRSFGNR